MTIKVRGKVWKYPGFGGWHFFTIEKKFSSEIRTVTRGRAKAFGSVRVKAVIGTVQWTTSIFPTKEKTYLLPIKADIRTRLSVEEGDTITALISLL